MRRTPVARRAASQPTRVRHDRAAVRPADRSGRFPSAPQDLLDPPSDARPGHQRAHRPPAAGTGAKFGMLRLRTVGRRSGRERVAMVGYYEDGPNLVTLAMNGWGKDEPAWWLEPPGVAGSDGRPPRRQPVGPRSCGRRRRAGAPLGDLPGLPGLGLRRRRPRGPSIRRDRGRHPRTEGWAGPMTDTTTIRVGGMDAAVRPTAGGGWRLRPRHLLLVPGLAIAILANEVGKANGVGILSSSPSGSHPICRGCSA